MYAKETQHDKIIRGLSIGLAFIFYGRQEQADKIIAELLAEKVRDRSNLKILFEVTGYLRRILSSAMVASTPLHSRTLAQGTMLPCASFCTSPSQTLPTMSEGLQSPHSPSSCSRIPLPSHVLSNCSVRATTPTSEVAPPLLWVSLVRVPVSRMLWRYSNP